MNGGGERDGSVPFSSMQGLRVMRRMMPRKRSSPSGDKNSSTCSDIRNTDLRTVDVQTRTRTLAHTQEQEQVPVRVQIGIKVQVEGERD
jgi:hypothetical protein